MSTNSYSSLAMDISNVNYTDIQLNDTLLNGMVEIKPTGLGIAKFFDPASQISAFYDHVAKNKNV